MDEKELSKKDQELIKKNLNAFNYHFKPIRIVKNTYNKLYYIYQDGNDNYIQVCDNIHYVNGWIYGAVQAICKVIKTK